MHIELSREQVFDIMVEHDVLGADTYAATRALVEYLSAYEDDSGESLALDPVALRCAFSIYTLNEAAEAWDIDTSGFHRQDRDEFILEYLQDRTTVIIVDESTVIVEEF